MQKQLKRQLGAKTSLKLIRNSVRVANVCADVIGDICRGTKWCNKCDDICKACRKVWNNK